MSQDALIPLTMARSRLGEFAEAHVKALREHQLLAWHHEFIAQSFIESAHTTGATTKGYARANLESQLREWFDRLPVPPDTEGDDLAAELDALIDE